MFHKFGEYFRRKLFGKYILRIQELESTVNNQKQQINVQEILMNIYSQGLKVLAHDDSRWERWRTSDFTFYQIRMAVRDVATKALNGKLQEFETGRLESRSVSKDPSQKDGYRRQ